MQHAPLHAFLQSAQGLGLLRRCAAMLQQWMRNFAIPRNLCGCDGQDDIAGEIAVLILERKGLRQELEEAAANGNFLGLRSLIVEAFKRHIQDQRRSSQSSAWHAMYRKTVRLLARRADFLLQGDRNGSWYAPSTADIPEHMPRIAHSGLHDYLSWPHPTWDHQSRLETNIKQAAEAFWKIATTSAGRLGLVAVRDLLAWLAAKGVVDVQPREAILESDLPQDMSSCIENAPATSTTVPLELELLEKFAQRIVATWPPESAMVFHLVYGQGLPQAKAAKIMGYASASGINYILRQAVLNLREMVSSWPELSEGEGNDQDQDHFLECLLAACSSCLPAGTARGRKAGKGKRQGGSRKSKPPTRTSRGRKAGGDDADRAV